MRSLNTPEIVFFLERMHMNNELITGEMLSEAEARGLLSEVQEFRREWAEFAVQSREQFDSFRDRGDSLPASFFDRYAQLQRQKEQLSTRIIQRTPQAQSVDWQPPQSGDSLHDFEAKLQDLIEVCRELERLAKKKYLHYAGILRDIEGLRCVDADLDQQLQSLRTTAADELRQLGPRSLRLADLELEKYVLDCDALLQLVRDTQARLCTQQPPEQGIGSARCLQLFSLVSERFGLPVAVEALRSGFLSSGSVGQPRQEHFQSVGGSGGVDTERIPGTSLADHSLALEVPATQEQIDQLIAGGMGTAGGKRQLQVPTRSVERIRISELTRVAALLEQDVKKLEMGSGCSKRFEGSAEVLKVRLKGFKNLAQSLRFAVEFFGDPQPKAEVDGQEARGIMLHRYMKLDDWADPSAHDRLCRELLSISRRLEATRSRGKAMRELRKSCGCILKDYRQYGEEGSLELWSKVDHAIRELVQGGMKANDAELRELLLPLIDLLPESVFSGEGEGSDAELEVSREFRQVAESVLDFVEAEGAESELELELEKEEESEDEELNPCVERVRELLRGRTLVVVGGVCKPHARKRLIQGLQLEDVRWLTARKQDKVSTFRSRLTGAAAVILLTKVIGHKHNDVRDMCREMEIPCAQTRVSSGYSVNQIASVILEQVSDQLSSQCAGQLI
jgi:hypothetical protein